MSADVLGEYLREQKQVHGVGVDKPRYRRPRRAATVPVRKFDDDVTPEAWQRALGRFSDLLQARGAKPGRGGGNWHCWHGDKNPSLSVDLEGGVFNCFGCGAGAGENAFTVMLDDEFGGDVRRLYETVRDELGRPQLKAKTVREPEPPIEAYEPPGQGQGASLHLASAPSGGMPSRPPEPVPADAGYTLVEARPGIETGRPAFEVRDADGAVHGILPDGSRPPVWLLKALAGEREGRAMALKSVRLAAEHLLAALEPPVPPMLDWSGIDLLEPGEALHLGLPIPATGAVGLVGATGSGKSWVLQWLIEHYAGLVLLAAMEDGWEERWQAVPPSYRQNIDLRVIQPQDADLESHRRRRRLSPAGADSG